MPRKRKIPAETVKSEAKKEEVVDKVDAAFLPNKDLFRIDEAAAYFSVTDRTIRLWIEHGHLQSEKIIGSIRISRSSILKCRFAP